ncbi:MAG: HEAT repeat domain-containing protein [Actinomycetes bacterium]
MEWLRIGDVARRTGLTPRTLRHYDELGLLTPSGRSEGDYRLYAPQDLQRLLQIQHLKSLGLPLGEVAAALDDPAFDAAQALERHIAVVESRIAAEQDLLARLQRLRDAAGTGWDEVLEVIALTERLRHPDATVRFRAMLDAPASVPLGDLLELLRSDPEPGVREAATWAVVHHGQAALDAVISEVADPDAGVRRQMAHVLGKIRDPRATAVLVTLLADPDADVAAKAAFALGQVGGVDAARALAGALGRGTTELRASVVTALGHLGAVASGPLLAALAAPEASTRADAAEALGHLEDLSAMRALARAASDESEDVRLAALMALGALGTDAARAAIREAGADATGRTRLLARRLSGSA